MAEIVLAEHDVIIPGCICGLADFRAWSLSDAFPERGRIDYLQGRIEVAMTPPPFCHALPLAAACCGVGQIVQEADMGQVVSRVRMASIPANLACQPDLMVVSWDALRSGRVRYVLDPHPLHAADHAEVEGGPDLVVEVVSPSSVARDTRRLPAAYFTAGVREFWLIDARGEAIDFRIHRRGPAEFVPVPPDAEGYTPSAVLGKAFRLTRQAGPVANTLVYRLEVKA